VVETSTGNARRLSERSQECTIDAAGAIPRGPTGAGWRTSGARREGLRHPGSHDAWRVVWPRWKLVGKRLLHRLLYFAIALIIGHWSVPLAWAHQGIGCAGHVWFSKKHGFTWYAVEDPSRYAALSKAQVDEWVRKRWNES
jgi:hypothetical protein